MTPESNSETAAQEAVTPAPATEPTPEAPAPVETTPVVVKPAAEIPIASTVSVTADPSASD
ncbi:MAG: hypothetical protein VW834_09495, partial [Synechococcus sp.]